MTERNRGYQRSKRYPGVFKQDGSWYFTAEVGRTANGGRQQIKRGGFSTAEAAAQSRRDVLTSLDEDSFVATHKVTVGEYLEGEWLPSIRLRVRPRTYAQYDQLITLHVLPSIGGLRLQALRARHVEQLYMQLLTAGRRDGNGGLSPNTVHLVHTALRAALRDAVARKRIKANPTESVKLAAGEIEQAAWTQDQLQQFLERVGRDRLRALWVVLATTGMRRGEVIALHWDDLHLPRADESDQRGRLSVRRAVTLIDNQPVPTMPKTAKARRTITLDPGTVNMVREHRERQQAERARAAELWQEHGLVFAQEDGQLLHPAAVSRRFTVLVRQAGLPRLSVHGLRHTYATIALGAGMPTKVVSERLGHASPQITDMVYAHVMPGMDADAAVSIAERIFGSGTQREVTREDA